MRKRCKADIAFLFSDGYSCSKDEGDAFITTAGSLVISKNNYCGTIIYNDSSIYTINVAFGGHIHRVCVRERAALRFICNDGEFVEKWSIGQIAESVGNRIVSSG